MPAKQVKKTAQEWFAAMREAVDPPVKFTIIGEKYKCLACGNFFDVPGSEADSSSCCPFCASENYTINLCRK